MDVHDLATLELELLRFFLSQLREQGLTVVANELHADLEAEVDDAFDHRLRGATGASRGGSIDLVAYSTPKDAYGKDPASSATTNNLIQITLMHIPY